MYRILFFLFLISAIHLPAQPASDEQLAEYYMSSGDFEKAVMYYEKLYDKIPSSTIYQNYLECLLQLEEYKEAEKLVKNHHKRTKNPVFYLDLGNVYEAQGLGNDAEKQYKIAIDELSGSQSQVIQLANKFIQKNKLELAKQTYEKGRKMLNGSYTFNFEMASLYGSMGDHEKMIEEYLNLVEFNEGYLQTVQNGLNRSINFLENEEKGNLLKNALLKRVQKQPDRTIFSEMLIWLFIQRKDFNAAFIQVKALDKRHQEDGRKVLNLGYLCQSNGEFETAAKCFEYVSSKGPQSPLYQESKLAFLRAERKRLDQQFDPGIEQLQNLTGEFRSALSEFGENSQTVDLLRDLALIEAYHLDNPEEGMTILQGAIGVPGITSQQQAYCKLDLADLYLTRGLIWDASLLYSQVEKDFKHDALGAAAKFKNAKLSYYSGDFQWAQAQLDVLKGSTSKLISNDAMDLSLLITDNLGLDTIMEPMMIFARADLLSFQGKLEEANATLDSISLLYPGHSLTDEVLFQKGNIFMKKGAYEEAINYFQQIIDYYPDDIMGDNALFTLADLYQHRLKDPEKAGELYKQLMLDYPGSLFVVEARKRFRHLRGDDTTIPAMNHQQGEIHP